MNILFFIIITGIFWYLYYKVDTNGDWVSLALDSLIRIIILILYICFVLIWGGIFWW